jgi:hypothetical protein
MFSSVPQSFNNDQDVLYSSATPSHTRRPSWPLSFGFDSNFSTGSAQYASMSSIPFPSGQIANLRRSQTRGRDSGDLPQPWMFAPDNQVYLLFSITPLSLILNQHSFTRSQVYDSEEVLYVASPPTPQFPPTIPASPSLTGRKRSTRSGYPSAEDSSKCIYTASPKSHPSYLPTRNTSFPPSSLSAAPFQPSGPYSSAPSSWNGNCGGSAAIYSTSNSTGCLFSSSGSSGALLSLNQANLMLLQKNDVSHMMSSGGGSRSRRSSHGRTSSLESISEEEEE